MSTSPIDISLRVAAKVQAAAKRAPKKKPLPKDPRVVNVGVDEAHALEGFGIYIKRGLVALEGEWDTIRQRVQNDKEDDDADDSVHKIQRNLEDYWSPDAYIAGDILDPIKTGLGNLAERLSEHVKITGEQKLVDAIKAFGKNLPDDGIFPKGKDDKVFKELAGLLKKAQDQVPDHLNSPGALGKLRDCFETITHVAKILTGKSLTVPQIPMAVEPVDPRQTGFGFQASYRR